jgi:hypothetical protein
MISGEGSPLFFRRKLRLSDRATDVELQQRFASLAINILLQS